MPKAYKKNKHVGPGGMGCPCCAPSPKHRKAFFRARKKAERALAIREATNEYNTPSKTLNTRIDSP
jgi:hypothetical protein